MINRRKVGTTDDKSDNGSVLLSRNIGSLFDSCIYFIIHSNLIVILLFALYIY